MKAKSRKKGMIVSAILLAVVLALGAFVVWWFFFARYPDFDGAAKKEGKIPVEDGFCPQGLCPVPGTDSVAVSGYSAGGGASRIYIVGETSKYVTLTGENGALNTHFGGVTCTGNYFVVASGKSLVRVPVADVLAAENGGEVAVTDSVQVPDMGVAYCYYDEGSGLLFAGEFYRSGNYETPISHHITVKEEEVNTALVYAYEADESKAGGVASSTPVMAISVPGLVQGIAVYEGGIALSTSYGLPDSDIYFHRNILGEETSSVFTVGETQIPLYKLGSETLERTLVVPCMSEEIFQKDGRLYILFESACDKYKLFVRRQMQYVYSIAI